ncbi:MAG TPA: hypothetical protein VNT53_09325 [Pseudolysinimonas sp.]|nr:hypothetical protein [Pseudolysinimonas sp.]
MAPRWTDSSDKHGVPRADQVFAIVHANYKVKFEGEKLDDGDVWLYIGHPHAQTQREVEVLVNVYPDGREALVFHAMELGPKFRRYRQENPDGN